MRIYAVIGECGVHPEHNYIFRPYLGLDVDRAVPVLGYFPVRRL